MVTITKPSRCGFRCLEPIVALDFQPRTKESVNEARRLAAAAGSQVKIWSIDFTAGESLCVAVLEEHAPAYLVALRWSPNGANLATADSRTIVVFAFKRFTFDPSDDAKIATPAIAADAGGPALEIWKPRLKMSCREEDVLDLVWLGDGQILTGGNDVVRVWDVQEQRMTHVFEGFRGPVKGVCAHNRRYFAAQGDDKVLLVWEGKTVAAPVVLTAEGSNAAPAATSPAKAYRIIRTDGESFVNGPPEVPYYRRGSFDAGGYFAAFPGGERGAQSFGVMHLLDGTAPHAPFRFRGHVARVCAVAFSRTAFHLPSKGEIGSPPTRFTLYSQASIDGALSIWSVTYPSTAKDTPEGRLLLFLKPRFLDEEASVVDMSWTCDGRTLAIGADDGSITLVTLTEDEIHGKQLVNPKRQRTTGGPPAPRDPRTLYAPAAPTDVSEEEPTAAAAVAGTLAPAVTVLEPRKNAKKKIAPTLIPDESSNSSPPPMPQQQQQHAVS